MMAVVVPNQPRDFSLGLAHLWVPTPAALSSQPNSMGYLPHDFKSIVPDKVVAVTSSPIIKPQTNQILI